MTANTNTEDRAEGQRWHASHDGPALGSTSPVTDHVVHDTQLTAVGGGDSPLTTTRVPTPRPAASSADLLAPGHTCPDAHSTAAGGNSQPPVGHGALDTQSGSADGWLELRVWCEMLEDAMAARIAATNRAERGGVSPDIYQSYIESLSAAEHVCQLAMIRCYRRVVPPEIRAWQQSERGIGDKLTARLLGHLGDPCIATPHWWEGSGSNRKLMEGEPYERTLSQLWQYCGVGDPARRKQKGMTADELFALGNPTIKMLLHLHAESCVKAASGHFREVYDKARFEYQDRCHAVDCVRCGPSGKPALVGSPWSKGHQHAAALRKVSKEILRDLWRVRRAALCPPIRLTTTPSDAASAGTIEQSCPPTCDDSTPKAAPSAGTSSQPTNGAAS